jgi:4-carboxymuconolactone decarboxylase
VLRIRQQRAARHGSDRRIRPFQRENSMVSERYAKGEAQLRAVDGEAGVRVVRDLSAQFPDFAAYLLEYPFGDIYARPGLALREREIATVAALCAMGNAAPQLKVHLHAALHVGCAPSEIVEVIMQMSVYAGFPAALNGLAAVRAVFAEAGIALPLPPPHAHSEAGAAAAPGAP